MNPYSLKELEPKPSVYTKFHHYSKYLQIIYLILDPGLYFYWVKFKHNLGENRIWTDNFLYAKQTLYQLSYVP